MAKLSFKILYSSWWVVLATLSLTSVYSAWTDGNCTQMCDKYRAVDTAFTLDCDDHPNDDECKSNCKLCAGICSDYPPKKVYNCPQGEVKRSGSDPHNSDDGDNSEGTSFFTIYIVISIIVTVLILSCSLLLAYKRIQNGTCCEYRRWNQPGFLW